MLGSIAKILVFAILFFPSDAAAAEGWKQLRSNNFNLIGSADEQDMRQVAAKLEEFRNSLKQILNNYSFDSNIPTTVLVFKSDEEYAQFKPRLKSGEIKSAVKGHFIGGRDVNYITLSVSGTSLRTYQIIFHEYAHLMMRTTLGDSNVPSWLNEGLAVYYETLLSNENKEIILGTPPDNMLSVLRNNDLIPLETFFKFDNLTLHEQGEESVGLFYSQAWALTHFLIHGENGKYKPLFDDYIKRLAAGKNPQKLFTEIFNFENAELESKLRSYIRNKTFAVSKMQIKNDLKIFETRELKFLSEAETTAILGDLLLHSNRLDEAEIMLERSLMIQPDLLMARVSLGLIRLKQNKFAEAEKYLEDAAQSDAAGYLTYFYYAYSLSKKGMTNFGFVLRYSLADAEKMRDALKRSIALNPNYAEAYDLYAFINIVRTEELDEAVKYLNKALEIAPGNQWYQIHLAEIYLAKNSFEQARQIAAKVTVNAGDPEIKVYSQNVLQRTINTEAAYKEIEKNKNNPKENTLDKELTDEELAQLRAKQINESLNESLYRLKTGETRILGNLTKIECRPQEILYYVKSGEETITLRSRSFDTVRFVSFTSEMAFSKIGCELQDSNILAVVSYRQQNVQDTGEIVSIDFVPRTFSFIN